MMLRQEKKKMREVSLYEPIGMDADGNHISLLDVLCTEEESLTDRYLYQYYLEHLEEILDTLEDVRDKDIILARYGLRGQKPKTQREVAEKMGISRSYVSRFEKKVLQKLKEQCDKI